MRNASKGPLNLGRRINKILAVHGLTIEEVRTDTGRIVAETFGGAFTLLDDDRVFVQRGLSPEQRRRVVDLLLPKVIESMHGVA